MIRNQERDSIPNDDLFLTSGGRASYKKICTEIYFILSYASCMIIQTFRVHMLKQIWSLAVRKSHLSFTLYLYGKLFPETLQNEKGGVGITENLIIFLLLLLHATCYLDKFSKSLEECFRSQSYFHLNLVLAYNIQHILPAPF